MNRCLKTFAPVVLGFSFIAGAGCLNAQVTDTIKAHVDHSFMIGDKTLPAGDYTFRMTPDSTPDVMTAENGRGNKVAQFAVRQSTENRAPKHTQLTFRKYGDTEFLVKVYQGGRTNGIAVTEASNEEKRLISSGQHGIEFAEDQP